MTMVSSPTQGERRQLTVVFSDVVGSTELSAQLDPEDWHGIVSRYHNAAANVVKRFEGHVAQYLGDGILILFGYPKAHENDAERAIRAGLALFDEIKLLNNSFQREFGKQIQVRVGIHTGEVMVGDTGNVFGEAPNIAARVQSSAKPDTVCISAATQHLVAGFFIVEDMGPHILKGVSVPLQLYRVERSSGVRSRLSAVSKSALTRFVGREAERNQLMSRWLHVQKGRGQLVMITGEAGIGKSRLLQQFKEDLGGMPHTWIEGESSPYEQDTPFAPTLDLVKNAFHWRAETSVEKKIEDLDHSFAAVGMNPAKSVPLMASLLGLALPAGKYPPLLLSPDQQRLQLLQTLVDWVIGNASLQPTVLVIEDLHFADPSTLEELVLLGEQIENTPLLLFFTARPRFQPPWPSRPYHTLIAINRLEQENVRDLIQTLLGKLVPGETMASLVERADGNPLFAEELSQTLAGARATSAAVQQIPSTLQDLLMARLDYLGPVKDIAQIGSVLGRAFSHSLLAAIAGQTDEQLHNGLIQLAESGLVFAERDTSDTIYTFKHALVQEAAYGSLLKSRRRELHRAAAAALRENFSDVVKQRPELYAHHLTEAGDIEPAIEAWELAGEYAAKRAAHSEAERHFTKALKVLEHLPDTPERAYIELPLQMSLGNALKVTAGFGHERQIAAYSRAREISEQLGESVQFLIILLNLWGAMNSRSELIASRQIADDMVRLAAREQNNMISTWGYEAQAIEAYSQGKFAETLQHFEEMRKYYQTDDHLWSPFDPMVTTSIHASLALWHAGLADQARAVLREQYQLAKDMQASNVAMAYLGQCSLYIHMRMPNLMLESAREMVRISIEHDIPSYTGWGTIYIGVAQIFQKNYEEGIATITRGVADYLATGTHSSLAQYLSVLAEGYAGLGDIEKALDTIEYAFGAAGEEHMHLPELHNIKATLLTQRGTIGDMEEAEREFHKAIVISQEFGSLSLELRAVTRLGRLFQSCGRAAEAQALLAPLYAKFTEGFDTSDLIEAKKLLDELSATTK
jgi:class 3 adenylate cyclase/tetratricopeptide (TPR) repeat protein/type II secretory pathway predicted ATPase ExeA